MGSNPAGGMDICLLRVLCVVRYRSLRRADHSSRGVVPSGVCVCDRKGSITRRLWPTMGLLRKGKKHLSVKCVNHLLVRPNESLRVAISTFSSFLNDKV